MKQTANTKLNQWEKSDRIMMSDFNSDNQKLDAALKSLAGDAAAIRQAYAGEDAAIRRSIADLQAQINALTARTLPTLLKEVTTTKDANPIEIDMSFIDWDLYDRIIVESRLVTSSYYSTAIFAHQVRGYVLGYGYARTPNDSSVYGESLNRLTLTSHGDKNRLLQVRTEAYATGDYDTVVSIGGTRLKTLLVYCKDDGYLMKAGCYFRISGVKA